MERETRQNFSKSAFALTNQFQITAEQYSLANVEDVKMNLAVKRRLLHEEKEMEDEALYVLKESLRVTVLLNTSFSFVESLSKQKYPLRIN